MIRNRTTVVAETLKRKVVKDRTVILRQRFASLALEVLADRDSVTLLEKAFDRRIAVRKEMCFACQCKFSSRSPDLINRDSNSRSLSNIRDRKISSGKMLLASAGRTYNSVGEDVIIFFSTGK